MCGICGQIIFEVEKKVQPTTLKKMTDTLIHRGPDEEGFYIRGKVGLGMRRLSIIDLEKGQTPLSNEDDSIQLVFNGEIYNYKEIRQDLRNRGHHFKTQTDSEVIVHLYEEYGKDCVHHLRGMFAFAIWDERKKKLFCARDRFGIKSFFFHLGKKQFVFGSEIKAILGSGCVEKEIDLIALDSYFAYKYVTDDRTIFKKINKLKAAHTLEISWNRKTEPVIIIEKYWNISQQSNLHLGENEWSERLEQELSEAVKMRMVSDVPIGAFLSGGVDSSSIVALMSKHSSSAVKTFSVGFKEKKYSELDFAREVSKRYQTEHHEYIIEPNSIDILPMLAQSFDEPFADSSVIPTYFVSKFAKEQVSVVLSGDGGDELFAGYDEYNKLMNLNQYNLIPHAFNEPFWGTINKMMPNSYRGKGMTHYLSKRRNEGGVFLNLWTADERKHLYKNDFWNAIRNDQAEEYKLMLNAKSSATDYLFQLQEMDMQTYLTDDVLTKVDRMTMLNSLEARVPILDHKVAELSFQIPSHFKIKNNQTKYILKKAMHKYLPTSVINHPKQGFILPLEIWFKGSLKEYVYDRFNSRNSLLSNYLDMNVVRKTVKDHNEGKRDLNDKIWSLLFFDAWLSKHQNTNP